jgi:hypothetical protein
VTAGVIEPGVEEGACSNPECAFSEDGVCVARGDVHECEYFEPVPVDDGEVEELEPASILLPSGEALGPGDLDRVLADKPARTVVMLGLPESGKTTLMCLIFDQLRTRRALPWRFTRSKTIVGFARRGHDSSMRSGRAEGTTPRTSRSESGMSLHIGCREDGQLEDNLLLVDLSGEQIADLADGNVDDVVASALARADHIPVVVDGRHIADPGRRALAIYGARALLGAVDRQTRPDHASVSVVLTKGDLLVDVDTDAVFDEITRATSAQNAARIVSADRESEETNSEDGPLVERGEGVVALLSHLTTGPSRTRGAWPPAPVARRSALLAQLWGRT